MAGHNLTNCSAQTTDLLCHYGGTGWITRCSRMSILIFAASKVEFEDRIVGLEIKNNLASACAWWIYFSSSFLVNSSPWSTIAVKPINVLHIR